jgi:hypothetical protein
MNPHTANCLVWNSEELYPFLGSEIAGSPYPSTARGRLGNDVMCMWHVAKRCRRFVSGRNNVTDEIEMVGEVFRQEKSTLHTPRNSFKRTAYSLLSWFILRHCAEYLSGGVTVVRSVPHGRQQSGKYDGMSQVVAKLCSKVKWSHTGLGRPLGLQEVEAPRFLDYRHMKVVRLSALRTTFTPQERFLVLISVRGWVDPRAIVKNSNDTIGNRTRDVPDVAQWLNQLRHRLPHMKK